MILYIKKDNNELKKQRNGAIRIRSLITPSPTFVGVFKWPPWGICSSLIYNLYTIDYLFIKFSLKIYFSSLFDFIYFTEYIESK
jgi:hypothetical protein